MKESIAAIKWVLQGLMIAAMLGASWLGYKFITEPGYLANLAVGREPGGVSWEPGPGMEATGGGASSPVVTSRLPQASGLPQAGQADTQRRLSNGSGSGKTTGAGTYAPRTTATDGLRTVSRKKEEPTPAYTPPVAERKVIRVGE